MLATVAMVVPSLKVLLMITELPTLMGTSRIRPVMVERIRVLLKEALFLVMPSFTISRLSFAVCSSSRACFTLTSPFSYSSALISLSLYSFWVRAKSVSAGSVDFRQSYAAFGRVQLSQFGYHLYFGKHFPCFTLCPASLYTSAMIPEICGLIRTSSLGSTLPVATVVFSRSVTSGTIVSYTVTLGWDFWYRKRMSK